MQQAETEGDIRPHSMPKRLAGTETQPAASAAVARSCPCFFSPTIRNRSPGLIRNRQDRLSRATSRESRSPDHHALIFPLCPQGMRERVSATPRRASGLVDWAAKRPARQRHFAYNWPFWESMALAGTRLPCADAISTLRAPGARGCWPAVRSLQTSLCGNGD